MSIVEVKVPDIGDFKDVAVIELLVKPGDTVSAEQSLITVESDKASMEIPSSHAGVVKELKVNIGDKVNQGSLILTLDAAEQGAAAPAPAPAAAADSKPNAAPAPAPSAPAAMFSEADRRSKNCRRRSMGSSIRSCRHRPGSASSCSRVQATPWGMNLVVAPASTASASARLPTRHSSDSVFSRAPAHTGHGV